MRYSCSDLLLALIFYLLTYFLSRLFKYEFQHISQHTTPPQHSFISIDSAAESLYLPFQSSVATQYPTPTHMNGHSGVLSSAHLTTAQHGQHNGPLVYTPVSRMANPQMVALSSAGMYGGEENGFTDLFAAAATVASAEDSLLVGNYYKLQNPFFPLITPSKLRV